MAVVLLSNLLEGLLVVQGTMRVEVQENMWVEVHLLDLGVALIVALMVTGLETAKLEIGRISVIAVEREVI